MELDNNDLLSGSQNEDIVFGANMKYFCVHIKWIDNAGVLNDTYDDQIPCGTYGEYILYISSKLGNQFGVHPIYFLMSPVYYLKGGDYTSVTIEDDIKYRTTDILIFDPNYKSLKYVEKWVEDLLNYFENEFDYLPCSIESLRMASDILECLIEPGVFISHTLRDFVKYMVELEEDNVSILYNISEIIENLEANMQSID